MFLSFGVYKPRECTYDIDIDTFEADPC